MHIHAHPYVRTSTYMRTRMQVPSSTLDDDLLWSEDAEEPLDVDVGVDAEEGAHNTVSSRPAFHSLDLRLRGDAGADVDAGFREGFPAEGRAREEEQTLRGAGSSIVDDDVKVLRLRRDEMTGERERETGAEDSRSLEDDELRLLRNKGLRGGGTQAGVRGSGAGVAGGNLNEDARGGGNDLLARGDPVSDMFGGGRGGGAAGQGESIPGGAGLDHLQRVGMEMLQKRYGSARCIS